MDFRELLAAHGIRCADADHRHTRGGWVNFDCPFCPGGMGAGKYHMGYNTRGGYVNCWACGRHRLGDTLAAAARIPLSAALRAVARLDKPRPEKGPPRSGRLILPPGIGPLGPHHRRYLRGRGFDPDTIARLWGVQGIGVRGGNLAWRLFMPVHYRGRVVSWITRAIAPNITRRYLSATPEQEEVSHKTILYGEDYCRFAIIVVEGAIGAWTIGPGCVATCGIGYTQAQAAIIARYPTRVICFDNEPQAQQRAAGLVADLAGYPGKTYNIKLGAKDADTAPAHEIAEIRKTFLDTELTQ